MCQQVYLITSAPLPLVEWDDAIPEFHVSKKSDSGVLQMLRRAVGSGYFFYSVGSFMGCSCGLSCNSSFEESEPETYAHRLADSQAFKRYLLSAVKQQTLWLFTTNLMGFPDVYPKANLNLSAFETTVFDLGQLPEDVLLLVTT